jgi:YVTN family beta-propeller protein
MSTLRRATPVVLCVIAVAACGSAAGKTKPKRVPNYGPIVKKTIATDLQPCGVVAGFGVVWISNLASGTVQRIDPATNRVTATIKVGAQPCGLAIGAGSLWINGYGTNSVERVDPATNKLVAHIPVGSQPYDVLFAGGSVWTTNNADRNVMRIDPATNQVIATIPVGEAAAGLAFAAGSVWVGTNSSDKILRIDPSSLAVRTISTGKTSPAWFSSRDDDVWVASVNDGVVFRVAVESNTVSDVVRVRTSPVDGVLDENGLLWIPNRGDNSISIVDAASATAVTTLKVGPAPFVLNDGFGDVWSPSFGGQDVRRVRTPRIADFDLAEASASGQHGTVRLVAIAAKKTRVIVTLTGAPATETVHIHGGRCGAFTRASFARAALRNGRASLLLSTPIRSLTNGRYALDVHRTARDVAYVACANLG